MELTRFIEELLGIKLKSYQKIAIENFSSNKDELPKKAYEILNSYSEFHNDGFLGSMETYYNVRNNVTGVTFTVHEDNLYKYKY